MAAEETAEPDRLEGAPHPREAPRLVGHVAAQGALASSLASGRMHHAWLISGPRGVGKATLAYRAARAVIAEDGALEPPRGCAVARRMHAGSESRLAVLRRGLNERTGRLRTQITIDEVRGLKRFLSLSASDGGWRAVIVDPADELNPSAANAALKLLEEPPARTVLFLVAHSPAGLLPTIRSRCRSLALGPLAPPEMAEALDGAGLSLGAEEIAPLAELSGGAPGRAVGIAAGGGLALYARMVGLLGGRRVDRAALSELADLTVGRGREAAFAMIAELATLLAARLARAGAGHPPADEAAPGERALMARRAGRAGQGRLWAEAAPEIARRARHAQAVNLDPAQTILDIFLHLDDMLDDVDRAA